MGAKSYRFLLCCFSSSCPSCNISISNKCLVCICLVPKVQWPLRTQAQLILLRSVSVPWKQSCWYVVTSMAQTVSSCDNPTPQWCWNKRLHLALKFFLLWDVQASTYLPHQSYCFFIQKKKKKKTNLGQKYFHGQYSPTATFSQYEDYTLHAAIAVGLLLYLYCIKSAFISLKNNNNKKWPENCSSVPGLFNIQDVNSFPKLIHFNTNCIQNLEGINAVGAHLMSLWFVKNSSHYLYSYSLIRKPSIWSTSISVTVQFVILTDPFAPGNPISP